MVQVGYFYVQVECINLDIFLVKRIKQVLEQMQMVFPVPLLHLPQINV